MGGNLTNIEKVTLILCFIIGWISTYMIIGYIKGFDAWGIKVISFMCGNFAGLACYRLINLVIFIHNDNNTKIE